MLTIWIGLLEKYFAFRSREPIIFYGGLKRDVREMLARDNPIATQLLVIDVSALLLPHKAHMECRS